VLLQIFQRGTKRKGCAFEGALLFGLGFVIDL
jgi:hypothetical protein